MKRYLFVLTTLIVAACSNQEKKATNDNGWDVTVSGKVAYPQEGQVYITELTASDKPKGDTISTGSDGSYSVTFHVEQAGYYRFNFYNQQFVDLVLDHSNIELNVDGNNQSGNIEIKGSPDYDLIRDVQQRLMSFQESAEAKQIEAEFQEAVAAKQDSRVSELQDRYMELRRSNQNAIIEQLKAKPASLGLINLLQGNTFDDKDLYFPFYKEVAAKALASMPTSEHVQQFNNMVQQMSITAIGQKAPEISLPDPDGKIVTLSSFRGKYVMVDFWAKWCGPCRAENPWVVKAYKKFHPMGFEVLGVSLDRTKEDWVQAIRQDGLTWTHVSDLRYFESQAAQDYNINAIPFSILVDPDGVIIAKNTSLRRAALERTLSEVFGKEKKKS